MYPRHAGGNHLPWQYVFMAEFLLFNQPMRTIIVLALLLCGFAPLTAQKRGPMLQFLHNEWHFGKVSERYGTLKHKFPFVNDGDAPLWLTKVEPSCACTSPEWTHDTIMPGDTGYVSAGYQTYARPGEFDKTIAVFANTPQGAIIIRVKGEVFMPYDESTEQRERMWYGDLRFTEQTVNIDPLWHNKTDTFTTRLINHGNQPVSILSVSRKPAYVTILNLPEALDPGETVLLRVVVDGSKVGKWGYVEDNIQLLTDDPMQAYKQLAVMLNVKEYFPPRKKSDLKKLPRITLAENIYDHGKHREGAILHASFTVSNTGKSPLVIRSVTTDCACVKANFPKYTLEPGETIEVKTSFDTVFRTGLQMRPVKILSNDPNQTEINFYLKANVVK
jgi:hypothetical protein